MEQIWNPMAARLDFSIWWIVVILVLAAAGSMLLLWRYRNTNRFCIKVWGIFKGILQGFSSCMRMEKKWLFFAYTAFIWMTYWLMAASIMSSLCTPLPSSEKPQTLGAIASISDSSCPFSPMVMVP